MFLTLSSSGPSFLMSEIESIVAATMLSSCRLRTSPGFSFPFGGGGMPWRERTFLERAARNASLWWAGVFVDGAADEAFDLWLVICDCGTTLLNELLFVAVVVWRLFCCCRRPVGGVCAPLLCCLASSLCAGLELRRLAPTLTDRPLEGSVSYPCSVALR